MLDRQSFLSCRPERDMQEDNHTAACVTHAETCQKELAQARHMWGFFMTAPAIDLHLLAEAWFQAAVAYRSAAETGSASSSSNRCSMLAASLRLLGCSDGSTTRQGWPCTSGQQTGSCSADTQEGVCSPVTVLPTEL